MFDVIALRKPQPTWRCESEIIIARESRTKAMKKAQQQEYNHVATMYFAAQLGYFGIKTY